MIYVRQSTAREDSISPEVQEDACRRYAQQRGYEVVDVVQDLDLSGRHFAKRRVGEIIERVKAGGHFSVVLVWRWSRWGRNVGMARLHIAALEQAGGRLESATEPIEDVRSAVGNFQRNVLLSMAEFESDQKGEQWKEAHALRLRGGKPHSGQPRFGYIYDDEQHLHVPDPERFDWLARAYRDYIAGLGTLKIARIINDAGVTTARGNLMTAASLRATLDSGFGAGLIRRKVGEDVQYVEGVHEPAITRDEWEAYLARRSVKVAPRAANPVTPLSGLVVCAACQRPMKAAWQIGTHQEKVRAFKCAYQKGKSTKPCTTRSIITLGKVTGAVQAWLIENAENPPTITLTEPVDLRPLERTVTRLEKRHARALELYLSGGSTVETARGALEATENELQAARDALERARAPLPTAPPIEAFTVLLERWNVLDLALLRNALRRVIARVEVRQGSRWDDRVTVVPAWEDTATVGVK